MTLFFLSENTVMSDTAVAAPADKKGPPQVQAEGRSHLQEQGP